MDDSRCTKWYQNHQKEVEFDIGFHKHIHENSITPKSLGIYKFLSVGSNGLEVGHDCFFGSIPKSGF
jgi:hypothetical protein